MSWFTDAKTAERLKKLEERTLQGEAAKLVTQRLLSIESSFDDIKKQVAQFAVLEERLGTLTRDTNNIGKSKRQLEETVKDIDIRIGELKEAVYKHTTKKVRLLSVELTTTIKEKEERTNKEISELAEELHHAIEKIEGKVTTVTDKIEKKLLDSVEKIEETLLGFSEGVDTTLQGHKDDIQCLKTKQTNCAIHGIVEEEKEKDKVNYITGMQTVGTIIGTIIVTLLLTYVFNFKGGK